MNALEAIEGRHSVRSFTHKPISKEKLEQIINAARLAPTANNKQPWEFIVITNSIVKSNVAEATDFGKFISQAAACVAVYCEDTKYYLEDGCAATENILLAAHALGISSCWVAGDKKPYCARIGELLGVPAGYKLVSLVSLGYTDHPPTVRQKRSLREVLHWDKFQRFK